LISDFSALDSSSTLVSLQKSIGNPYYLLYHGGQNNQRFSAYPFQRLVFKERIDIFCVDNATGTITDIYKSKEACRRNLTKVFYMPKLSVIRLHQLGKDARNYSYRVASIRLQQAGYGAQGFQLAGQARHRDQFRSGNRQRRRIC